MPLDPWPPDTILTIYAWGCFVLAAIMAAVDDAIP